MRRRVGYFTLAALVVLALWAISQASGAPTAFPVRIRSIDNNGVPVDGAMIWLYGHTKEGVRLLASGVSGKNGYVDLSVSLEMLSSRYDPRDYIFETHAFKPGLGLAVKTWAVAADGYGINHVKEVVLREWHMAVSPLSAKSGSGKYRTIESGPPNDFTDQVRVQQLHYIAGLNVQVKYTTTTSTTIEAGMKYIYPTVGTWTVTGTVTKKTGTECTWHSSADRAYCHWLETRFTFRETYWELQEEDGDIPGVWHTIQAWKQITPLTHNGGNNYGARISCTTCKKDLEAVLTQPSIYGTAFEVSTLGSVKKTVTGSLSTSWGYDGKNFAVTVSYAENSEISHEFSHQDPSRRYGAYDMKTGVVYYVTREPLN